MDYHRQKQKQFSSKSSLLPVVLAIFTGVIMMTIPLAPVVVFAANIQGTAGDDTLNGTPQADTINGFEGYDKLFGEGGDDTLDGGTGEDEIHGGDGNDEIKDGSGDPEGLGDSNKVYGGSGDDNIDLGFDDTLSTYDFYYVYGEDGADYIEVVSNAYIEGGPDDDIIYCTGINECPIDGGEGDDEIHAEFEQESTIRGGSGNDELYVESVDSSLIGDDGNDYLFGGAGSKLKGSEGDDVLEAARGGNTYNGGPGADTFKCSPDTGDIVEDYNPGEGDTVSDDCEIVEDATPPDVEITQVVDKKGTEISEGGTTNSKYIKITFTATEGDIGGISGINCILDGQRIFSCKSPVVYDKLKKGTHEFTVIAWDAAISNPGEDEFTWTIGNTPPPRRWYRDSANQNQIPL